MRCARRMGIGTGVVELLRAAAGDGRLTAEELAERLEVALTARTHGELARLTTGPRAPITPRIDVSGEISSGITTAGPPRSPRRTFWQWLRRRPRAHSLASGSRSAP